MTFLIFILWFFRVFLAITNNILLKLYFLIITWWDKGITSDVLILLINQTVYLPYWLILMVCKILHFLYRPWKQWQMPINLLFSLIVPIRTSNTMLNTSKNRGYLCPVLTQNTSKNDIHHIFLLDTFIRLKKFCSILVC